MFEFGMAADYLTDGRTGFERAAEVLWAIYRLEWMSFCDPFSTRFALREPWVADGWRYATDQRIAIRFPVDEPSTTDDLRRPDLGKFFESQFVIDEAELEPLKLSAHIYNTRDMVGRVELELDERSYSPHLIAKLKRLPDVRYQPGDVDTFVWGEDGTIDSPLCFVWGGIGQGMLMPLMTWRKGERSNEDQELPLDRWADA